MKAREYNSPLIKELIDETTTEELNKIDKQMSKQQTAVEWLEETMLKPLIQWPDDIWEQAKEMEKEQRKKTWDEALESVEKKLELLQRNIRR